MHSVWVPKDDNKENFLETPSELSVEGEKTKEQRFQKAEMKIGLLSDTHDNVAMIHRAVGVLPASMHDIANGLRVVLGHSSNEGGMADGKALCSTRH